MVDRSNDYLYTWTLEPEAMKNAGCCLTLFDPAKGAPEMEFELTRSEIEPMDVTVTRDRGLGQSDEQVRFEGGRLLTLREAESTRTWRQEQEIHSLPAPPGSLGGYAFAWAGEVRLTNEDVDNWRIQYRADATDCPWPDHRACLQCPRCAQPAAPGGDDTYFMVWQTLAQVTETGPKTRTMPRLFCRPCIERIVQLADPRYTPPAPLQLAIAERPELPSMADRISTLESLRASGGITEAEFARAKALAERAWEDFLDSTEPFGVRHRFAAGPSTAYDLHKRWVRSGTFDALVRLLHADFTGMVSISRTAMPGSPYNLRDPSARCRREGCDRARAPDGMPLKTCARCRSVMYCSPVRRGVPRIFAPHASMAWRRRPRHRRYASIQNPSPHRTARRPTGKDIGGTAACSRLSGRSTTLRGGSTRRRRDLCK